MLILGARTVRQLLAPRPQEVVDAVRAAYLAHAQAGSVLPHSLFLRPPGGPNRFIALPAYLESGRPLAGVKWIASFPDNIRSGLDRASAVMVLNSTETGRAEAILEASAISAQRTAASAALAASVLRPDLAADSPRPPSVLGVIGCGVISLETVRYLRLTCPDLAVLRVFDLDALRADAFAERCRRTFAGLTVSVDRDVEGLLDAASILSIATTATRPHLSRLPADALVLHISLRDLSPEVVLGSDNVVDDADHVCREQTSLDLAARQVGHRDFIRATLGDVLLGRGRAGDGKGPTVFSPFGLGILDLAVAAMVVDLAVKEGVGTVVADFHDL